MISNFPFLLHVVCAEKARDITVLLQQYWEYLEKKQKCFFFFLLFFVPTSLCQCCFKSGYIVLDKPETMWEGTLVAHIGCCFENPNLGIVIECRIISGEKKKTLMNLWLWRMFVVCRFWFVQQYFLFCVVYTTVPTSTINGRLLNDQRQKLTSVQCKQLFLELVSTPPPPCW